MVKFRQLIKRTVIEKKGLSVVRWKY